ncbi:MAG TPA: hypothetical protein VGS97_19810 [Actinocrinis sp.]|uniref:hypothetical protein n=1 Tax=Actinocrinis sp. TaxID=1920516 RepID=UPI002DDCF946|nr:hypothetical protein [Actinocrinis sp.]HEV2346356.1 hypothetical protein [Actinocrinis sp.]
MSKYSAPGLLPMCEPIEYPPIPDWVFQHDAFMRNCGYQRADLGLDADMSNVVARYTRADKPALTWQEVFGAMDRLVDKSRAEQWMLGPLLLPHWLPEPLRPVAELWAREHGWDGVVYDEPPSWLRDRPMKTNPEVWHG